MAAKIEKNEVEFGNMVMDCLGCKWTLTLLHNIEKGINRPGRMVKAVPGLSTKVLNENLRRMKNYGLIEKRTFAEIPPRVEYRLTEFGYELSSVLDSLKSLQRKYCQ